MTLKKLTLVNFQKHKKLSVQLDPRVTVLTGPSDAGKSSVIRALRWLSRNQPGGNSFMRVGPLRHARFPAKVRLEVGDTYVIRSKSKDTNAYGLGTKDFNAFGTGVPDEIASLLNLDEVNFQRQHESVFWLALSSGEAARRLNEIVNLETIDKALAEAASRVKKTKAGLEASRERLDEATKKASQLEWAERAWQGLLRLEKMKGELEEARRKQRALAAITEEIARLTRKLQGAREAIGGAKGWSALGERLLEAGRQSRDISGLVYSVEYQQSQVAAAEARLRAAEDKLDAETDHCPICGKIWKK